MNPLPVASNPELEITLSNDHMRWVPSDERSKSTKDILYSCNLTRIQWFLLPKGTIISRITLFFLFLKKNRVTKVTPSVDVTFVTLRKSQPIPQLYPVPRQRLPKMPLIRLCGLFFKSEYMRSGDYHPIRTRFEAQADVVNFV